MKLRIKSNGYTRHTELLIKKIRERIPIEESDGGTVITLNVNPSLARAESYEITATTDGWCITGACSLGLYYGIGKFLHTAKWSDNVFAPAPPVDIVTPACDFRAMYFAVHFYNWYHMAPMKELEEYLVDMLLWGYNTVITLLPVANIVHWRDSLHTETEERLRIIFRLCKQYGIKIGMIINPNQANLASPEELRNVPMENLVMRGNLGFNVCLSKPGAMEYMRTVWQEQLTCVEGFGLDYVLTWPYDEGGCGCKNCRPWGANKYLDGVKYLHDTVRDQYPEAKFIVSTWAFDDPVDEGEYAGLYRRLDGDMAWVDYLMVDSHGEFPTYVLNHTPLKPIVNFPEISMWGLIPWGGFGANPLPQRFQSIWNTSKWILNGGMPYSEGLYEDLMKIQFSGYYWNPDATWEEILGEYIRYEYSPDVTNDVLEMIRCIERNHTHIGNGEEPEISYAARGGKLARQVNEKLPARAKNAWRWRVLYIRAILDEKRYAIYPTAYPNDPKHVKRFSLFSGDLLIDDPEAQDMFAELQRYYHCVPANGMNHFTLPPLGGTAHWEEI
ncbi:MAG: hypothetical protein IJX80_00880 [Clostridia bacterium]|nr:hypothetical protein [Clostridia bacterium]